MKPPLFRQALPGSAIVLIVDDEPSTREASFYDVCSGPQGMLFSRPRPVPRPWKSAGQQCKIDILLTISS